MYLTFENPIYLWFLFAVPLFIVSHFFFLRQSKSKAMKFANFEALKRVTGDKLLTKNMTHLVLRVLVIFGLVIAVSGTTLWYKGESSTISYVIAMDTSASMSSSDIKPSRFEAAKLYAADFVDSYSARTRFGLVSFSGVTLIEKYPLDSKTEIKIAIENLDISRTGGTDVPGAIITSTNMLLSEREMGRSIIIISDGVNTLGAFISDSVKEAVNYAVSNQVVIHAVGIGTDSGPIGYLPEYYNISSSYDEDLLKNLAERTGGNYVYASSADDLLQAFDFLKENTEEIYLDFDVSFMALLIALALLFIEWGLANSLYRRIL